MELVMSKKQAQLLSFSKLDSHFYGFADSNNLESPLKFRRKNKDIQNESLDVFICCLTVLLFLKILYRLTNDLGHN